MSTPVAKANDVQLQEEWEVTPVIIKTGGGTVDPIPPMTDPQTKTKCTIGLKSKDFVSNFVSHELDKEWESAKSNKTAGILEVHINDGSVPPLPPIIADRQGELAVLQISYGDETLILQDVAIPDSLKTKLAISSSIPFTVTGTTSDDEWRHSEAPVPADPLPFIVFTQGERTETIRCQSIDVEIRLKVDWPEMD